MKTIRIGNLEWTVDTQQMTWWEADQHAHGLSGQGWRLPTVQDLVTGIDYDAMYDQERPEQGQYVWTRSRFGRDSSWMVSLSGGYILTESCDERAGVRLVRDAEDDQ